jgi:hypothetical protein
MFKANCRIRNTVYGDRKQLFRPITKRGVSTLFKIMAKKAKTCEHISEITNYERLEFLGRCAHVLLFVDERIVFVFFRRCTIRIHCFHSFILLISAIRRRSSINVSCRFNSKSLFYVIGKKSLSTTFHHL